MREMLNRKTPMAARASASSSRGGKRSTQGYREPTSRGGAVSPVRSEKCRRRGRVKGGGDPTSEERGENL